MRAAAVGVLGGTRVCRGAGTPGHTRADGVSAPRPRALQQLLPQPRALALDGAGQLSLYTSPSLPNISLGLQATVTVTSSHLSVSGDMGARDPREGVGTPRRGWDKKMSWPFWVAWGPGTLPGDLAWGAWPASGWHRDRGPQRDSVGTS